MLKLLLGSFYFSFSFCFCFQVKEDLRNDKRYKAVKHEERENLFEEYVAELKAAEVEAEQSSKAKLEEQVCRYSELM
jgi:FF domain